MGRFITAVAVGAGLIAFAATAQAQLITEKVLSADMALEAGTAAMAACRAIGQGQIMVVVIDNHATVLFSWIGDHGNVKTYNTIPFRKAYAALNGTPSGVRGAAAAKEPQGYAHMIQQNPMNTGSAGGVPIKVGNETIAAIGVGGSNGEENDDKCAKAGVAKIQDRLH